jgi:L-malate glycosyltransferase
MVPSLSPRDAVGTHTLVTAKVLAEAGYPGHIWVEGAHPELRMASRFVSGFESSPAGRRGNDLILYQASSGSKEMVPLILSRPEPKLIAYHNVTPPEFFEPYDEEIVSTLTRAREELRALAEVVKIAIADSEFNAQELRSLGIEDVRVTPPYFDELQAEPSHTLLTQLQESKAGLDILFVGRVAPNKGHAHLLRTFAAIRATIDPHARLFIVGSWGPRRYMNWLFSIREKLAAEGVVFTGSVSQSYLESLYRSADVFLCLSEHEGFGIPLIEAMRHDLPVVAYDAGAVAGTLDSSGVLVRTLDPTVVSEVVASVCNDVTLRKSIIDSQHQRLESLDAAPRRETLLGAVRDAIG